MIIAKAKHAQKDPYEATVSRELASLVGLHDIVETAILVAMECESIDSSPLRQCGEQCRDLVSVVERRSLISIQNDAPRRRPGWPFCVLPGGARDSLLEAEVLLDRLEARMLMQRARGQMPGGSPMGRPEGAGTPQGGAVGEARGGPASAKRFRVALSFPGEKREFVQVVADHLADKIGRERVLYDKYHEAEFARPNLDTHLQGLYHDQSELIAVFLCADYERKEWPGLEWRAIRDLIKRRESSAIMLFRFDSTEIPGLFSIDGYIDVAERSADDVAALILKRLESNTPAGPKDCSGPAKL